jgi:hypothetical protein
VIPLAADKGQIAWTKRRGQAKSLSVRSEQISVAGGVASTYSCANSCCDNRDLYGWVNPSAINDVVGGFTYINGTKVEENCFFQQFETPIDNAYWSSSDTDVEVIGFGTAEAVGPGSAEIHADWTPVYYLYGPSVCEDIGTPRRDSAPATVACAIPTNFHQTVGRADGGNLEFEYRWNSSTGKLTDLSGCRVGEYVTYPGTGNYFPASPPFPSESPGGLPNPSAPDAAGNMGVGNDIHRPGSTSTFVMPYQAATYTAVQIFRYKCPCKENNAWQTLLGPLDIVRTVSPSGNNWKYTITKSGVAATIDPLP